MLKNVKSKYIIKLIFSYIDECSKLKLVKHSLAFQNILNMNIDNYKYFYRRYINYKSNGKVIEYNLYGRVEFEGDYKNGQRNGKGEEYYYDGNLLFEGEYLNGKRNGKGIEYNYYGSILFEGEYLNGKKMEKELNIIIMVVYYLKVNI